MYLPPPYADIYAPFKGRGQAHFELVSQSIETLVHGGYFKATRQRYSVYSHMPP